MSKLFTHTFNNKMTPGFSRESRKSKPSSRKPGHGSTKLLALLLTLVLALTPSFTGFTDFGVTPVRAATASGSWGKNITWKFKNGTLTISGKGAMQDTPRKFTPYQGWTYYPICANYKEKITKVVIEEGVTAVGGWNFYYWYPNIKTVVLPSTLKRIGNAAFSTVGSATGDSKLSTIQFSGNLKSIGSFAFCDCVNLKKITFPKTLTKISRYAFSGCKNLTSIDLPSSIQTIDIDAFIDCPKVSTIKIRNKNCKIADLPDTLPYNAIIYGYKGSTAESFAQKYNRQFRILTTPTKVKVTKVRIKNAPTSLKVGKSVTLKATVTPKNATNKKVTWKVSNTKYAKITASGKLTAKKAGKGKTLRVSATAKDGTKKRHVVKIKLE